MSAGRFLLQGGEGAQRHQLAVWSLDVSVFKLVGIEPFDAFELRDDLVTAAFEAETIHEVAAYQGREIGAHGGQVQAQRGHLVAVHRQLDLGLVDLRVDDGREGELATSGGFLLQVFGKFEDPVRFVGGSEDNLDRE